MPDSAADANPDWQLFVRDELGVRKGQLTAYEDVDALPKHNNVGTYALKVPASDPLSPLLMLPGHGVEFVRDGTVFLSGPLTAQTRVRDETIDGYDLGGLSDEFWLKARLCHPEPATPAPPYDNPPGIDYIAGPASTCMIHYADVNAGPGALAARRVPGLTLAADPVLGPAEQGFCRWQNLLEIEQLYGRRTGLGFRVRGLQFEVFQPADKTSTIVFSEDLGNLVSYRYSDDMPASDFAYVGGAGALDAQVIVERSEPGYIATWGRIETFVNSASTSDADALAQAGDDQLLQDTARTGVTLTAVDLAEMRYGDDYQIGDLVTAVVNDVVFSTVISEVRAQLDAKGETLTPGIGATAVLRGSRLINHLTAAEARLANLERH